MGLPSISLAVIVYAKRRSDERPSLARRSQRVLMT